MKTANLKDERLNRRLLEILAQLSARPTASIPAACGGHAEMAAAYRFFDNEKATFDSILQSHLESTHRRLAAQPVVLLTQDTTEIEVTRPEQQMAGAGPLDGNTRRGAFLHLLHAFTPDGTPLGTAQAAAWTRDDNAVRSRSLTRAERANIPIEEKESYRWIRTLQKAREIARQHGATTKFVCLADSEADIHEYLLAGAAEPRSVDWIVRSCQDRAVVADEGKTPAKQLLRKHLLSQPVLFTHTISVRGRKAKIACETRGRRQPRESRTAEVAVRAGQVTIRGPQRPGGHLPSLTANVVLVSELAPPPGDVPVEWVLITSLPIDELDQVREVIQYYCGRWLIEVLFRVLKSGCRVEERRFEHMDRMLPCLAVYLIVAWRTFYVCRLGRSCPDIPCDAIFDPCEWKAVWKVVNREDPPQTPPALAVMVRMVAQLGGYVHRKRQGPPGPQTIWIGLQRAHDFAICWQTFGPDARKQPSTCV